MTGEFPLNVNDEAKRLREAIAAFEIARDAGRNPDPQEWLARYPELAEQLIEYFLAATHAPASSSSITAKPPRPPWAQELPPVSDWHALPVILELADDDVGPQEEEREKARDKRPNIGVGKALGWLVLVFLIQILLWLGLSFAIILFDARFSREERTLAAAVLSSVLLGLLGWLCLEKKPGRKLALRRIAGLHLLLVLLLVPPLVLVGEKVAAWTTQGLNEVFGHSPTRLMTLLWTDPNHSRAAYIELFDRAFDLLARQPWGIVFLLGCLLPAVNEEIFFRGFLGRGLVARYGAVPGVLCTSVLFGLVHIDPVQASNAMILGIVLHWVYLCTKTLLGPMLLHMMFNASVLGLRKLYLEEAFFPVGFDGSTQVSPLLLGTALLVVSALLYFLYQTMIRWLTSEGQEWSLGYVTAEIPADRELRPRWRPGIRPAFLGLAAGIYLAFLAVWAFVQPNWLDLNCFWMAYRQADSWAKKGQFAQALPFFDQAIDAAPDQAWIILDRGVAYHNLHKYDLAIKDYTEALRLDPSLILGYENRAGALNELGQFDKALADATKAIQLNPNRADNYNHRGVAHQGLHMYEQAVEDFTQTLRLQPAQAWAYLSRGIAYQHLRKFDLAINDYTTTIRLASSWGLAYENRAGALMAIGRFDQALADANKAIQLDPDHPQSYRRRGEAHQRLQNYRQAADDFSQAIRLDPTKAWDYLDRGIAYDYLGKFELAIKDYTEALKLAPLWAAAYENRAGALTQIGQFDKALTDVNKAIELDPKRARNYSRRGLAHQRLKKYQQAIEDYSQAIRMDPSEFWAYHHRGWLYFHLKEFKKSITDCDHAVRLDAQ